MMQEFRNIDSSLCAQRSFTPLIGLQRTTCPLGAQARCLCSDLYRNDLNEILR